MNTDELRQTIEEVATILAAEKIPFHLTGGLVSSFYGEPRFTQDIDIVLNVNTGGVLDRLLSVLATKFFVDPLAARDAVHRKGLFQALHGTTMIKVDFHVGEDIPGELNRSQIEEIFTGLTLRLASKEDAILSKLIWVKKGSHKSKRDIRMMLARAPKVDSFKLRAAATNLGLAEVLESILSMPEEEILA